MSNLYSTLTRITVLMMFLSRLAEPTEAYARDAVHQGSASETNLTEMDSAPDPSFTVTGTTYNFSAADCDPATVGAQICTNPIQASLDFLNGTTASSPWFGIGTAPDDGNIYVEGGTYREDIVINGSAGWGYGANTPAYLGIIGTGSEVAIVDGGFAVANMNSLTLSGFSVNDTDSSGNVTSIYAQDNTGLLKLMDIVVTSIDPGVNPTDHVGDGIHVTDHAGDIELINVDASNNSEWGTWLDNRAGNGIIAIESSTFNTNWAGLVAYSNRDITLSSVNVSGNTRGGTSLSNCNDVGLVCTGTGNISVSSSVFNNNDDGTATSHSIGLVAESNGNIKLSQVTANSNNSHGALLVNYFEGSSGAVLVEFSGFTVNGRGEIGNGLDIRSRGEVSILNVTAALNLEIGVEVYNGYGNSKPDINVEQGQFNENGMSGLELGSEGDIEIIGSSLNGNSTLAGSSNGLEVNSSGNISLSNVSAEENHNWGASLDNRTGQGFISVESSTFNSNDSAGLIAESNGNITFEGVIASYNGASGANAINCNQIGPTCTGTGSVIVRSSEFNNNGPVGISSPHWSGFVVYSNGDILLNNTTANSNNYHGTVIFNHFDGSTGRIVVRHSEFNENGQGGELGDGLKPESMGDILLLNVTASRNLEKGIEGGNSRSGARGDILVREGQFTANGWAGFELVSRGMIDVYGVLLANNDLSGIYREGAYLITRRKVTVSCSVVVNHPIGLWADTPHLLLAGVRFAANDVNYTNTGRVTITHGCK